MIEDRKKVSIVMCTYNGEKYIQEQLDSILSQTYPIEEIIIQDDASTDKTVDIIRSYQEKHKNIKLFRNYSNLGFNVNFKSALMKASSELVAIADQDDIWFPTKIEKQVDCIESFDICFSAYYRDKQYSLECKEKILPKSNIESLMFVNCIPGHTMLIKRDFLQNEEHWNKHICYDWYFLICACFENGIVGLDEPLNWHRPHENSAISTIRRKYKGKEGKLSYQPYLFGYFDLKKLKNKPAWKILYQKINFLSKNENEIVYKISFLLQKKDIYSLFLLCCLCMKNRELIYPKEIGNNIVSYIRGFFYPFIYAYSNTNFEM